MLIKYASLLYCADHSRLWLVVVFIFVNRIPPRTVVIVFIWRKIVPA
jgi:hypothetical protein